MSLPEAESYLSSFENTLREFERDLHSKSSTRILSSSTWMRERLTFKLTSQLHPLYRALHKMSQHPADSGVENNIAHSLKHTQDLIKLFEGLLSLHTSQQSLQDLQLRWAQDLEKIKIVTTSLRNRISIIKGMKSREKDPRNWLPF
ncbi:MAG TPA: hypothetical protein VFE88_01765 [Candidatus Nanoarchaeia archaeon]|nr:hypothetical protein [Candidatus Nanoarchaeia archaeon]